MDTRDMPAGPGALDSYTPRELGIIEALRGIRPGPALDADSRARAKDRLMLFLTAQHQNDHGAAAHGSAMVG